LEEQAQETTNCVTTSKFELQHSRRMVRVGFDGFAPAVRNRHGLCVYSGNCIETPKPASDSPRLLV
jgi:hypothetical protein